MTKKLVTIAIALGVLCPFVRAADEDGWIELFDGTLKNWQRTENMNTWSVNDDGLLVTHGQRSHLFYTGPVENADFKNFELKVEVKTEKGSNSGIYFHTKVQQSDWPAQGYEVQVNNTHSDNKKTGGLYAVSDVLNNSPAKDGEWFTEHIIVQGSRIIIKVDGKTTVDWTEPPGYKHPQFAGRKLSSGTFALQGHDPGSIVYYRSIKVKPLAPRKTGTLKVAVLTGGHDFERKPFFEMFNSFKDAKCTEVQLKDHSEIFEDLDNWDYDVVVMYNMTQNISKKRQDNFKALLDRGIGFVAWHHNMGAFNEWAEFKKIAGGKYYLKPTKEGDKEVRGSTYKHDLDMAMKIADKSHPITKGLNDFTIHDEGYKYCGFEKDNHILLTTDHADSDRTIAWTRQYGRSRVCGIMLGHDGKAFANPNFRKLLSQAMNWTAWRSK
ncbi:MAG: DUF1080 domain-containing protein [Sedimentisphaerales bacterium]|nr:DUF1080 domain-containing protein [Sedimentisphaerales bacterium]